MNYNPTLQYKNICWGFRIWLNPIIIKFILSIKYYRAIMISTEGYHCITRYYYNTSLQYNILSWHDFIFYTLVLSGFIIGQILKLIIGWAIRFALALLIINLIAQLCICTTHYCTNIRFSTFHNLSCDYSLKAQGLHYIL